MSVTHKLKNMFIVQLCETHRQKNNNRLKQQEKRLKTGAICPNTAIAIAPYTITVSTVCAGHF